MHFNLFRSQTETPSPAVKAGADQGYAVYTYSNGQSIGGSGGSSMSGLGGDNRLYWQRVCTNRPRESALNEAQALFSTGRYEKVEVKKNYICKNTHGMNSETVKIFTRQENAHAINTAVAFAFSLALMVFTVCAYIKLIA